MPTKGSPAASGLETTMKQRKLSSVTAEDGCMFTVVGGCLGIALLLVLGVVAILFGVAWQLFTW